MSPFKTYVRVWLGWVGSCFVWDRLVLKVTPLKPSVFTATRCCSCNLFSRWGVPAALSNPSFLSACLPALLADQQLRIVLSGIFPTGSWWDELWCDTLPSVLLGSQGDQDESPPWPPGDLLRSCLSCFWGPHQDAEDLEIPWYCTR